MKKLIAIAGLVAAMGLGVGWADTINTNRPVTLGDNGSEDTLQEVFNAIKVSGPGIDAVNDQTGYAVFTNGASGGSTVSYIVSLAGFAESNQFGMYQYGNQLQKALIFNGAASSPTQVQVTFLANGDVVVTPIKGDTGLSGSTTYTGFGNVFGFYLTTPEGNTFYSEDSLNPNSSPQALVYRGDDNTVLQLPGFAPGTFQSSEFIIAWEDLLRYGGNSDYDYNDLVVLVESINPVPEPATILLIGSGLAGLGFFSRKRRKDSRA